MLVNIPKLGSPLVYGYQYDQLNRLVSADAYNGLDNSTNAFIPVSIQDYKERLAYDPNGNIQSYLRNGTGANTVLNNYRYNYTPNTNQLASIDKRDATNTVTDNKTYSYDLIGNTTADAMQGMTNAVWNVYGKLLSITNASGQQVTYTYGSDGQRISKTAGNTTTWYVRDAAGNEMASYTAGDNNVNSGHLTQSAVYLYGSGRAGVLNTNTDMTVAPSGIAAYIRNIKTFELVNHLGNVMATVADAPQQVSTNSSTVDYFVANVKTATYYSSFGATANKFGAPQEFAFNGQRKSAEIGQDAQTAEFWEYNGDVGRRWNLDPIYKHSPYEAFGGNPIGNVDPNGLDSIKFISTTLNQRLSNGYSDGHSDHLAIKERIKSSTTFQIQVIPHPGSDVYTFEKVTVQEDINCKSSTTTKTTVLHPESFPSSYTNASGVTKGKDLYFDGLITTERDNADWESIGKFMNLDKGFYDYMLARNPVSRYWYANALSVESV